MNQEQISEQVTLLCAKNAKIGYAALHTLQKASTESNLVSPYLEQFFSMLKSKNAYERIRGLILIAANARWDADNQIDDHIQQYLQHITDAKPIVARQCIPLLPIIAQEKPALKQTILSALQTADLSAYAESMRPLILRDIQEALANIEHQSKQE